MDAVLMEKEREEGLEAGGPSPTAAIQVAERRAAGASGWGSWRSGCRSAFLE